MVLALVSACSPLGDDDDEDPTEPVAAPAGEAPTAEVGSSTPAATPIATPRVQRGDSGTPRAGVASPRTPESDAEAPDVGTPVSDEQSADEAQGGEPEEADSTEEAAPEPTTVVVAGCEEPDELPERTGRQNRVVAEDALRFRAGPGTSCDEITSLAIGTPVRVLSGVVESEDDDIEWVKVDIDGTEGWVAVEFLENPPDN